jgi:hypothetical protein
MGVLLAANLLARRQPAPWEVEATFDLPPQRQKTPRLLEVEAGRYRLIEEELLGNRSLLDAGDIQRDGDTIYLESDRGKRDQLRLADLQQRTLTEPRVHARSGWYQPGKPLQVDGMSLGAAPPRGKHENLGVDRHGRLWWLVGDTLTQSGRILLNTRSRRQDVEALFGPQDWRPAWGFLANHQQATIGQLSITMDDSETVIRLRLAR